MGLQKVGILGTRFLQFLKKDIKVFIGLDHNLMTQIVGFQSKVPIKFLYLETSTLLIKFILASRSLNYLHNARTKNEDELVKRVYNAQKVNPSKGD